jgi:RimJ/RimL family protein N-acetyltransferase
MGNAVTIRPYVESDASEFARAVRESIADLKPWLAWAKADYSANDALTWVNLTREGHASGTLYDFAVFDGTGRYAGACGINQIQHETRVANLGYWVRSSASGRGVAPAAVSAVVSWAFARTRINRLEIVAAVDNVRSRRVAEKSGAHFDAVLRKRLVVDGAPVDGALYSFVRPD